MRKTTNILLTGFLGISIFAGVCNYNKSKKTINWQGTRITGLESKIKNDSLENLKKDSAFAELLKDTTAFYSDSLIKISEAYNKNVLETKKLEKKVKELTGKIKKEKFMKGLEKKYGSLAFSYDSLKNEKNRLFGAYQKEISKNQERTNSSENYENSPFKYKRNFNVKNQNFFKNWKSLAPRLFSVGNESISFKDNDPENMEAFAVYPGTDPERVEPLKKISDGDKSATFAYPKKFLEEENCIIDIYAIDKNKNESGRRAIYKSGGIISRKEITD